MACILQSTVGTKYPIHVYMYVFKMTVKAPALPQHKDIPWIWIPGTLSIPYVVVLACFCWKFESPWSGPPQEAKADWFTSSTFPAINLSQGCEPDYLRCSCLCWKFCMPLNRSHQGVAFMPLRYLRSPDLPMGRAGNMCDRTGGFSVGMVIRRECYNITNNFYYYMCPCFSRHTLRTIIRGHT